MSLDVHGSTHPPFTKVTHRDVYPAIDPSNPSLSLQGKTVLIAGAGRGIGSGVVDAFVQAKVKTLILVGRSQASLDSIKKTIPKEIEAIDISTDIGQAKSVEALFEGLKGKVDKIDILVNTAGLLNEFGVDTVNTTTDNWWGDMEVNVLGPYLLARHWIKFNGPDYPGTFVSLTTGIANEMFPGGGSYMLSKVSVVRLAEVLAVEYPNIDSFAVSPGIVPTDMLQEPFRPIALDTPALTGGLSVWLSHAHAEFLRGRFISAHWDVDGLMERKDEILKKDLLKSRIYGWTD